MVLRGELKSFSFPGIINLIHDERKTGELILSNRKDTSSIFFQDGQIIFFSGVLDKEMRLGNLLNSNNIITDQQLTICIDRARTLNKKLGEVLVQNGLISRGTLNKSLLFQTKETIYGLFLWNEGIFQFKEGLDGLSGEITFDIDPKQILLEGKKWFKLKQAIPHERTIFQVKKQVNKKTSQLTSKELRLLFLIDGRRDIKEIQGKTGYSKYFIYSTVYKLLNSGIISYGKRETVEAKIDIHDFFDKFKFFILIIKLIMEDLKDELGKGADRILEECKEQIDVNSQIFLKDFSFTGDTGENFNRMKINLSSKKLKPPDMIQAFDQIVRFLFSQQSYFLGDKSVLNTIGKIEEKLAALAVYQTIFGQQISQILAEQRRVVSAKK